MIRNTIPTVVESLCFVLTQIISIVSLLHKLEMLAEENIRS